MVDVCMLLLKNITLENLKS